MQWIVVGAGSRYGEAKRIAAEVMAWSKTQGVARFAKAGTGYEAVRDFEALTHENVIGSDVIVLTDELPEDDLLAAVAQYGWADIVIITESGAVPSGMVAPNVHGLALSRVLPAGQRVSDALALGGLVGDYPGGPNYSGEE